MKIYPLLPLPTLALALTACHPNTYKIDGVAGSLNDGDTLLMTDALTGETLDTLVVKEGKFRAEGKADSVLFCAVYSKNGQVDASFFREPGTIRIELSGTRLPRVSGTKANNAWQQLNDLQSHYSLRLEELMTALYDEELDSLQRQSIVEQCEALQQAFIKDIVDAASRNTDNEMGFFIISQLMQSNILPEERLKEMIEKMPENFKQRL